MLRIMIWMNIPTAFLRSPEFVGAGPIERATWLSLLGYCCEQENGGEIANSATWKDRRWQQTCGVSLDEVKTESELWSWSFETLVLFAYPTDKEDEVRAKREGGRKGGKASAKARSEAPDEAPCEAMLEGKLEGELQRKRKEGKGKEEKGTARFAPPSPSDVQEYGNSLNPPFDEADQFVSFYESKGWLVGKSKMKDWKSAVRGWHARNKTTKKKTGNSIADFAAQNK